MKISVLLNTKMPLKDAINDAVIGCLKVGKKVPHSEQRLLNIRGTGEDAYGLTNISFHSLTVVTTGKPYEEMKKKSDTLIANGTDSVLVAYGTKTNVEKVIVPKSTRLFADKLKPTDLASVQSTDEASKSSANSASSSTSNTSNVSSATATPSVVPVVFHTPVSSSDTSQANAAALEKKDSVPGQSLTT